jgi:hypothetical protein
MSDRVLGPGPRLAVPAYFRPDVRPGDWDLLARSAPQVQAVILNVANGPGTEPDPAFTGPVQRLHQAGVTVAGYVDTNYGRRRLSQVIADLDRFREWYSATGVCFDRTAATPEHLGYYGAASRAARRTGAGFVIFNHGTHPVQEYASHADLLGTFEGRWPDYTQLAVPRWTRSWPAAMFEHVVYAVPPDMFGRAMAMATRRHAGCVFITDSDGANPYDRLPSAPLSPPPPLKGRNWRGLMPFGAGTGGP